jgi:hypothetical protein
MRDVRTDSAPFRAALRDLTMMLVYEASRNLTTELIPIDTPATSAIRLANPPLLVPVLRAGLGMADEAHALGLARDEVTLLPPPYMEPLPKSLAGRPVYVLDLSYRALFFTASTGVPKWASGPVNTKPCESAGTPGPQSSHYAFGSAPTSRRAVARADQRCAHGVNENGCDARADTHRAYGPGDRAATS